MRATSQKRRVIPHHNLETFFRSQAYNFYTADFSPKKLQSKKRTNAWRGGTSSHRDACRVPRARSRARFHPRWPTAPPGAAAGPVAVPTTGYPRAEPLHGDGAKRTTRSIHQSKGEHKGMRETHPRRNRKQSRALRRRDRWIQGPGRGQRGCSGSGRA